MKHAPENVHHLATTHDLGAGEGRASQRVHFLFRLEIQQQIDDNIECYDDENEETQPTGGVVLK